MSYGSEVDVINRIKAKVEDGFDVSSQAHKVKIVEGNVTLNAGDIEIGAVEIKDATTDNRVAVNSDGTLNVKISDTVTVSSTDLDIRNLDSSTDSISVYQAGTWNNVGVSIDTDNVGLATAENQNRILEKLGLGDYFTNDIDDYSETNIMYIGKEKDDGTWLILKLDMNSGTVIRGASEINNSTYTSYSDAWTNRLSLTYNYLKEVL